MRYKLRNMTIDDIPAVMEGERKSFGDNLDYDLLYNDLVLNPFSQYTVLEIDGEVHGYLGFWIDENADVIDFYVDEEYRHMGFGKMMLTQMIEICTIAGIQSISLEVRPSNVIARNLYESFGFVYSHIRSKYYKDGEDAWVYIKKLR